MKELKINGTNPANFNPYNKQLNAQENLRKAKTRKDQLEISPQAKQLQEQEKPQPERAAYVEKIKKAYESEEYKVDFAKTAQKMIDFWSK